MGQAELMDYNQSEQEEYELCIEILQKTKPILTNDEYSYLAYRLGIDRREVDGY